MAMANNRVIGNDGKIPWSVSDDFKWFKEFTMGKAIIIGKKTYDSLPPLKGRRIIVITNQRFNHMSNITLCNNPNMIPRIVEGLKFHENIDTVIAGGVQIYNLFMSYIQNFYVTMINGNYEGDVTMSLFEHLFLPPTTINILSGNHKILQYSKI